MIGTNEGVHAFLQTKANESAPEWKEVKALSPIKIVTQLNAEMDSGSLRYLKKEPRANSVVAPLSRYLIDVVGNSRETLAFIGTDSRALVCNDDSNSALYSHEVALVEPSKLLEGIMIDGFSVSQPEEESQRSSLLDVVNKLLMVTPFDFSRTETFEIVLTTDMKVISALTNCVSPQFKWNTQTTLWECLMQVGAVIDAIPRLEFVQTSNQFELTFDFINSYANEVDSIDDGATNTAGESIQEGQYNTTLSAIVENLLEE